MKDLRSWFLPRNFDVLVPLLVQRDVVAEVTDVVWQWVEGSLDDASNRLRELIQQEHHARRDLQRMVRDSFSTPIEAEDLFELGERLGETAEAAYDLVREAELSGTEPDAELRVLVAAIVRTALPMTSALTLLPHGRAAALADESLEKFADCEHAYRHAIAALENETDIRRELRRRELYQRAEQLARAVRAVARRTWYAVYKSE